MKYKGEEVGIPCQEMVQEFIDECGLSISAEEVLEYWRNKNFLTKKGQPVKTLEAMVHSANSIFVQRCRKCANNSKNDEIALKKAEAWLDRNFVYFCKVMDLIRVHNPEKWAELYKMAAELGLGIHHKD